MNTLHLKIGKYFRFFEGALKLELCSIARDAHAQFHFDVSCNLLGLDTDDAHAVRKDVLQDHEHQRPLEAARIEDGIVEGGAIRKIGDVHLTKIKLQIL